MKIMNRKAYHEYFILKEFVAGMKLVGSEVKALRDGNSNLQDSFVVIHNNEVYVKNMYISKNTQSSYQNHEEKRDRKLLLNKKEIVSLIKETKVAGITIIPLEIFILRGRFKMKIGLAQGKKNWDKRQSIKEKDIKRETRRDQNINY